MALNEVIKVTWFTQLGGQAGLMTHAYMQSSVNPTRTINENDIAQLSGDLSASVPTLIKSVLAQEAEYDGQKIRTWRAEPALDVEASSSAGAGPGAAANPGFAPRQLAGLIRKRTAIPTRRGKGRVYVPFPSFDDVSENGNPGAAYLLGLNALADELMVEREVTIDGQPATFVPCVAGADRPAIGIQMTDTVVATEFATQRRRGSFGRPNTPVF